MIQQIYLTLQTSILFLYKYREIREDSFTNKVTEHASQGKHWGRVTIWSQYHALFPFINKTPWDLAGQNYISQSFL